MKGFGLMALLMGSVSHVCFAALSEGAGGGGGDSSDAGGNDTGGDDQGGGGGGWTPPAGVTIPKEFLGTDANDTLSKLASGYGQLNTRAEGLRTDLAKRGTAPAKPEDYTFTPSEKVAPHFGDVTKNPALAAARTAAHKHGIPQAAFEGFINDVYGSLAESGSLAAPYSPKAEINSYSTAYGLDAQAGVKAFTENEAFASGLGSQILNTVPESLRSAAQAELTALTDTAGGQALLRALSGRLNQNGLRFGGEGGQQGTLTKEEAEKLGGDPRIDPRNEGHADPNRRFDPDLRKKYDAYFGIKG